MNRCLAALLLLSTLSPYAVAESIKVSVTIERGRDVGQSFGSLFEAATEDGSIVIGAGFQNAYNTRYRADRHAVQFFIRPNIADRELATDELPRPNVELTGSYLFSRDGEVYSTYGGLKSWNAKEQAWDVTKGAGGTQEVMRVGNGTLTFGASTVTFDGKTILEPPKEGSYQLFFYANGYLCFYHVNRKDKPYRLYENDVDGFSRLLACPWTPEQSNVDLSQAVSHRLPVVGETTFAWGQLGNQIVTGSNIGGFYVFENKKWRMILEPSLQVSYQLYSSIAFGDRLLMGQYPTGRVFEYDGKKITDKEGWPPVLDGVSTNAREAQTTVIYGGNLMVGVWPWGEIWRYNPDRGKWSFAKRVFDHPNLSNKITHPYDIENAGNDVGNRWGQRVTSLVCSGPDLFISTSAKSPYKWDAKAAPWLAPDKWKSYGKVYRATTPGHLSAPTNWTDGKTTIEFLINGSEVSISQDGEQIAKTKLTGSLSAKINKARDFGQLKLGNGIYGRFGGSSIDGTIVTK
jgi:hypothetical protein